MIWLILYEPKHTMSFLLTSMNPFIKRQHKDFLLRNQLLQRWLEPNMSVRSPSIYSDRLSLNILTGRQAKHNTVKLQWSHSMSLSWYVWKCKFKSENLMENFRTNVFFFKNFKIQEFIVCNKVIVGQYRHSKVWFLLVFQLSIPCYCSLASSSRIACSNMLLLTDMVQNCNLDVWQNQSTSRVLRRESKWNYFPSNQALEGFKILPP